MININKRISKAAVILLLATTIPFVGWSSSHAQDDDSTSASSETSDSSSASVAGSSADSSTKTADDAEFKDPEFKQAVIKHHEKMLFRRVKATSEQQTKLRKIMADTREAKEPLKTQLHGQMKGLHELMSSSNATDEQITEKAHELQQTEDKLRDLRLDTMLKMRAVLTPKQREELCSGPCCDEGPRFMIMSEHMRGMEPIGMGPHFEE